jgi:hypothetical protein
MYLPQYYRWVGLEGAPLRRSRATTRACREHDDIVDVGEGRDVRVARDTVTVVTNKTLPPVPAVAHAYLWAAMSMAWAGAEVRRSDHRPAPAPCWGEVSCYGQYAGNTDGLDRRHHAAEIRTLTLKPSVFTPATLVRLKDDKFPRLYCPNSTLSSADDEWARWTR